MCFFLWDYIFESVQFYLFRLYGKYGVHGKLYVYYGNLYFAVAVQWQYSIYKPNIEMYYGIVFMKSYFIII